MSHWQKYILTAVKSFTQSLIIQNLGAGVAVASRFTKQLKDLRRRKGTDVENRKKTWQVVCIFFKPVEIGHQI